MIKFLLLLLLSFNLFGNTVTKSDSFIAKDSYVIGSSANNYFSLISQPMSSNLSLYLPVTLPSGTQALTCDATGHCSWNSIAAASWGTITGTLSNQSDLNSALNGKQATLVSGTNIKTINSTSIVGPGNVSVQPTLVSGTNIKTINGNSVLGSGDLTIPGMVWPAGNGIPIVSNGNAWGTTITDNHTNWDTAYSWGNHASAGYLTSLTGLNLDQTTPQSVINGTPIFSALTASQTVVTNGSKNLASLGYGSSNTGSYLVQRDLSGNAAFNNIIVTTTPVVSSATTVAMTYGSAKVQRITGTHTQQFNLPDATYLYTGEQFEFDNDSSGLVSVYKNDGITLVATVSTGGYLIIVNTDNTTVNGTWTMYQYLSNTTSDGDSGLFKTGTLGSSTLTASKIVFTDTNKNLTSTGMGTSSQFIKGDGSLDGTTYLSSSGSVTGATSQSQAFTNGVNLSSIYAPSYVNLIPAMTSNTLPSPLVASASSAFYPAWQAFSNNIYQFDGWITTYQTLTGWIQQDLGTGTTISAYQLKATVLNQVDPLARMPKTWTMQGSNNGSSWTTLDTQTNVPTWSPSEWRIYTIASPASYRYYRLNITANQGSVNYLSINQLNWLQTANPRRLVFATNGEIISQGVAGQVSKLWSWQDSNNVEKAYLNIDGTFYVSKLGVGQTNPQYPVDVAGNVNVMAGSGYLIGGNPLSYGDVGAAPAGSYITTDGVTAGAQSQTQEFTNGVDISNGYLTEVGNYGGIEQNFMSGQTIFVTNGSTGVKLTGFDYNTNAASIAPDYTSASINILNEGIYRVSFSGSWKGDTSADVIIQLLVNSNYISNGTIISVDNKSYYNVSFDTIYSFGKGDIVQLLVSSGTEFNLTQMNQKFNIQYLAQVPM